MGVFCLVTTIPLKPVICYLEILLILTLNGEFMLNIWQLMLPILWTIYHPLSCHAQHILKQSLVRPTLNTACASPVWCLHTLKDKSQLESIQQCTAYWVSGNSDTWSWSIPVYKNTSPFWKILKFSLWYPKSMNFYSIQEVFSIFLTMKLYSSSYSPIVKSCISFHT